MAYNPLDNLKDPLWRINNLYMIVDKEGRQIPFKPNEPQREINKSKALRKMVLKARQFGISTGEIVKMFDWACFTPNSTAVILAHEQDSIKKLFRIVSRLHKFLPDIIKPTIDRGGGSKYELFFPEKNSRIYCDLESRGDTIGWLHVSEAAFMKDSAKLKSTLQAVPINTGRVTIETTANGMANHFYDMWTDTEQPYEKIFFPWYMFYDYRLAVKEKIKLTQDESELRAKAKKLFNIDITPEQIQFRRFKKAELKTSDHDKTRVTFEQEYPEDDTTCFLSSGDAVMDLFKIKKMMDKLAPPLSEKDGIKIYKEKVKGRRYVIGADPAEGIKRDYSVGVMIDIEALEVVAVARGQWKPTDFAKKLNEFGKMYSSPGPTYPIIAVERNNHGHAVLLELNEYLRYPELYVHKSDERLGWKTDSITRPIMINGFIDAIDEGHLKVNDLDILKECLTLVDDDGKIEAAEGKHDDCIAATAIAIQVCLSEKTSTYDDLERRILL